MKKISNFLLTNLSIVSGLIVFLVLIVRVFVFYYSSDDRLIGIIPDDSFYYFQLAKHRIEDGFWTFDGSSPATGFHLLYGYLLVVFFYIIPSIDWRDLYLFIGVLSTVSLGMSAFYCAKLIGELFDEKLKLFAVVPFLSTPLFLQSTAMMESWLVVFISTLSIYTVAHHNSKIDSWLCLKLILLGVFGSLARSDYGLIAGGIFLTSVLVQGISRQQLTIRATVLLAGAVLGLGIVLLHCYFISGFYTQASAQIKFYYSAVQGHNIAPVIKLIIGTFTPIGSENFGKEINLIILVISIGFIFYSLRKAVRPEYGGISSTRSVIFISCILTLIGYILFYRHNSAALQLWYSANFAAPVALCISGVFYYSFRKMRLFLALTSCALFISIAVSKISYIPYPHQAGMLKAGLFLKELSNADKYGSWNAGIISYFSGKRVVNLDGLVNDDVVPYIKNNRLFDYLEEKKIRFLVDYEIMLPTFGSCIRRMDYVDGNSKNFNGSRLSIFAFKRLCNTMNE
jgi:hypothetical protein